jgi:magnesium-transporting ATPase (P-type)
MINWHSLSAKETAGILGADLQVGLSSDEARRRLDQYGPNELEHRRPKSVLTIFLQQFMSPLIYILFAAAIISLALGHIIDAEVILFVVLANALIGTFQEGKAVKAVESRGNLYRRKLRLSGEESVEGSMHQIWCPVIFWKLRPATKYPQMPG